MLDLRHLQFEFGFKIFTAYSPDNKLFFKAKKNFGLKISIYMYIPP